MASGRRKLIVVSNRGPVSYARERGERVPRRGGGGLVTALRSLVSHDDVTWIASAMTAEDTAAARDAGGEAFEETARDGSAFRLRLLEHEPAAYDRFYNVFSNPLLWFLQHYLWELAYTPVIDNGVYHAWDEGYVKVNRAFADAVIAELEEQPDAAVFFHDYHLYLAPRFVRNDVPDATLAHFVHIPWPQRDYWNVLPEHIRAAIHDGLLANDIVGVHTQRWQVNLLRCLADIVGASPDFSSGTASYRGRTTLVTHHPISVDAREFDELAASPAVLAAEEGLVKDRAEKLIVRVDRTDPSKNVVRGLRAFELYLAAHPHMQGRVVMLTLLDPSRQDIPEYSEYLGAIQREARRVNERFERADWQPIDLRIEDNFPESVAAYKQFDALFVNAIYDGMNLVAKEAPLVNTRDGALILSENAGAHEELGGWAITVNPFDVYGQAEAIHRALSMPGEERRRRLGAIRAHVAEHDQAQWIEAQLRDLDRAVAPVPSR
jgi:trehalose 6-phosphate synthase